MYAGLKGNPLDSRNGRTEKQMGADSRTNREYQKEYTNKKIEQ